MAPPIITHTLFAVFGTLPSAMHEKVKKYLRRAVSSPPPPCRHIVTRGIVFFPPLTSHQTLQTLSFHPPAPIPGALRFQCLVCLTNHSSALPNELEARAVNNVRCTLTGGTGQQGRIVSHNLGNIAAITQGWSQPQKCKPSSHCSRNSLRFHKRIV